MRMILAAAQANEAIVGDPTARQWIAAAAILFVGALMAKALHVGVARATRDEDEASAAAHAVGRIVGLGIGAVCIFYALGVLGVRLGPLVGALGIGGLALAYAGQNILANFLASIMLQFRHPFRPGDQVCVASCEGTVDDINFRTVVLRTFEGERVMVPCAEVLATPIINHTTLGRRRTTLDLSVAYETDLDEALDVLRKVVQRTDGVLERPAPEVWVEEFADSGISIAVRFWHAPDVATLWRTRSAVAVEVKRALDEAGISIPFPQRVLRFADDQLPSWLDEEGVRGRSRD